MTATARSERRARLKVVVSEPAETAHIDRTLRNRLRLRRERHGAMARREAERQKQAPWVDPEELAREGNPHDLETVLRSGRVRARFYHSGRWWQWREAAPREAIRIGSDGRSLVDNEQWVLRIHQGDWSEYMGGPSLEAAAPVPAGSDAKTPLADADEGTIRAAIKDDYEKRKEAGEKARNLNEIITPVKRRLEQMGFYAARKTISKIAHNKEFEALRERPGPTWKNRRTGKRAD